MSFLRAREGSEERNLQRGGNGNQEVSALGQGYAKKEKGAYCMVHGEGWAEEGQKEKQDSTAPAESKGKGLQGRSLQ